MSRASSSVWPELLYWTVRVWTHRLYCSVDRNIPTGKDQISAKQEKLMPFSLFRWEDGCDSTVGSAAGLLTKVPCIQAAVSEP